MPNHKRFVFETISHIHSYDRITHTSKAPSIWGSQHQFPHKRLYHLERLSSKCQGTSSSILSPSILGSPSYRIHLSSVPFPASILGNYSIHTDDVFNILSPLTFHYSNKLYFYHLSTALRQLHPVLRFYHVIFNSVSHRKTSSSTTFLFVSLFSKYTSPSEGFTSYNPSWDPQGPSYLSHYH